MPQATMRHLVGRARTRHANRQLGVLLAFVAGAVNAGGFLAIRRYTSHMTGVLSGIADDLALGAAPGRGRAIVRPLRAHQRDHRQVIDRIARIGDALEIADGVDDCDDAL